ncbi:MAG: ABC transporter ATP-binding protein [Acidimicrobiales bacterium]
MAADTEGPDLDLTADDPTRGGPNVLLDVRDVSLSFGGVDALTDVSYQVREGELFAVIGPNGAGKTSIFNCLNAVYRPQRGQALLDGEDLLAMKPADTAERGVARTFQNLALFENLSVIDNLMLGRHHLLRSGPFAGPLWWGKARREEREHRARCAEIADFLDLDGHGLAPVGTLPYGVQKRIELGRALAMEPRVLLLDEPVAGMNQEETEITAHDIVQIRRELGITTILVEHAMDLVMDLADRVMVLDFGKVVAIGTPDQIQSNERVHEVYLGSATAKEGAT